MKGDMPEGKTRFSTRSQRSLLEEADLKGKLAKCDNLISICERKIRDFEKRKTLKLGRALMGLGDEYLAGTLKELEDENRKLIAFKGQRRAIQSEIEKLQPTPANAAERAEQQNHVASLVTERFKKDEFIEGAIRGLRRLLEERRQQTSAISKAAEAADFTLAEDVLDAARFEALLAALPVGVLGKSADWLDWFLGRQKHLQPYVVVVERLVLSESLARAGVFTFGDRIELTEEEAKELLRDRCPLGSARHDLGWYYERPQIMSSEAFEAFLDDTDGSQTPQEVLSKHFDKRANELMEQYIPQYQEARRIHREDMMSKGLLEVL